MKDVKKQYLDYLDSKEGAEKYNEFKSILYGEKDSLIPNLFKIIYPKINGKKDLSILDIGGGDGKRLRHIIDLLEKKGITANADLVEPSKEFTKNCRFENAKKKYSIKVERNTFEKFTIGKKYDLIFLIHSIYTFKNKSYLKKIKKFLNKDGMAVFVVNDANSFLAGLKRITDTQYKSSRNELGALLDGLGKNKFKVRKFDTKFSRVLDKKGLNRKGKLILEWLSMENLPNVSLEIKEKAKKFFIRRNRGGYICEREVVIMTNFKSK